MNVLGIAGFSGAGKTSLVELLIELLRARGLRVSVVKHAHHDFDIDHEGKDSWRHRKAGASEVLIASDQRLALIRELPPQVELSVHDMLAELDASVDWVLVEGFKFSDLPKLEIWRHPDAGGTRRDGSPRLPRQPLYPHDSRVQAVATDDPLALPLLPLPPKVALLDVNHPQAVLDWMLAQGDALTYVRPLR